MSSATTASVSPGTHGIQVESLIENNVQDRPPVPTSANTDVVSIRPITPDLQLSDVARHSHVIGCLTAISKAFEEHRRVHHRYPDPAIRDANDEPVLSWRVAILPLLGYKELYEQFKLSEPWDSLHNRRLLASIPPVYQSPERGDERTNFLLSIGPETPYLRQYGIGPTTSNFVGGPLNTMLLAEFDDAAAVPWTKPLDFEVDLSTPKRNLGGLRKNGFFAVFGELGTRFIAEGVSDSDLAQLMVLRKVYEVDSSKLSFAASATLPSTSSMSNVTPNPPPKVAMAKGPAVTSITPAIPTVDISPAPKMQTTTRPSPPSESELQLAESTVKSIYEPIYRMAKSREEQRKVAVTMLEDAATIRQEPSSFYVMLRIARDIATTLRDFRTANLAARELQDTFELDPVECTLPWLETAAKKWETNDALAVLFDQTVASYRAVLRQDNFEACVSFQKLALTIARKMNDRTRLSEAMELKARTERARKAYQSVGPALHTLLRQPNDSAANAIVGRYLCLHKADWDQGLIHLSKGDHETLKSIAILELGKPTSPELMADVGDAYWSLSDGIKDLEERESLRHRAGFWYRQSVEQLSEGLRKVLLRERLKQLDPLINAAR